MNLFCKIFGHQPPSCSKNVGGDYGKIEYGVVDRVERRHAYLSGECPRCGETYHVMSTHVKGEGHG